MSGMNYQGIVVGPPAAGKSTLVASVLRSHLDNGAWVFAHDPNHQFQSLCAKYKNAGAWKVAAAKAAADDAPMPRGALFYDCAAEEVSSLAVELGERHNRVGAVRFPMVVAFDEGSLLDDSGQSHVGKEDGRLMATRRHKGVGLVWNVQSPTMLMRRFWELSTDAYLFRQPTDRVRTLEQLLGLNPGELAGLPSLPAYRYYHWQAGKGLV